MAATASVVQDVETAWGPITASATVTTSAFNVVDRDIVVAVAAGESTSAVGSLTISGGSLGWYIHQSNSVGASRCSTVLAAAVASTQSMSVTATRGNTAGSVDFGAGALVFRGASGVGASVSASGAGVPAVNITTTQPGSIIVVFSADWAAIDGSSRAWLSVDGNTPVETIYGKDAADSSKYTVYASYVLAGNPGVKTVGLTTPGLQEYSILALEILGASPSFREFSCRLIG